MQKFLHNMYEQTLFQQENESLPNYQTRIDDREYVAQRVETLNPGYAAETLKWVREKRKELHLDEIANNNHTL